MVDSLKALDPDRPIREADINRLLIYLRTQKERPPSRAVFPKKH
jgi:hypothetical protein